MGAFIQGVWGLRPVTSERRLQVPCRYPDQCPGYAGILTGVRGIRRK